MKYIYIYFDQNLFQKIENTNNANNAYDLFHKIFLDILNKHDPLKILSKKREKTIK